jgi:hypothetical protein
MNNLKYAGADMLTLKQFETILGVDRARRLRICKENDIEIIDIGIDTRQPRIARQAVINLYNHSIVHKPKQAGKPRAWGDLQLISFAQLRTKFNIPASKVKLYAVEHKMRVLNICGSNRIPLSDIKLLLSRRATIPGL